MVEISGRQYLTTPGRDFLVDKLDLTEGEYTCEKVLMVNDNKGFRLGNPYLEKTNLVFKVVEEVKMPKIRVAKFHAKANTRKVKGSRAVKTRLSLTPTESGLTTKK